MGDDYDFAVEDFGKLINPLLASQMQLLKLDKIYHKAVGSHLYYLNEEHHEVRVADFVSGYGAVLLGHNHKKINQAAIEYLNNNRPGFTQLSVKEDAVYVARWLFDEIKLLTGRDYVITFANSGAEAVEAGIKHALMELHKKINDFKCKYDLETRSLLRRLSRLHNQALSQVRDEISRIRTRNDEIFKENSPVVLAVKHAFHGKTLRAAMTCWNVNYNHSFSLENTVTDFIGCNTTDIKKLFHSYDFGLSMPDLDEDGRLCFKKVTFNRLAASIVEPIQGEGGVYTLPVTFLEELGNTCLAFNVPFIIDEIQTGCYRTGHLLVSAFNGIVGDYYILGKAMGGGIAKVSALLIVKSRYIEQFGTIHSSTFAEDGWSSHIALEALQLLKEESKRIQKKGGEILKRLEKLKQAFPSLIQDVRGRGLMLGIEFKDLNESNIYSFQLMARSGYLHYLYAAYLLNVWNVRVAAPLSAKNVLRVQPPVCITERDINQLLNGLYCLCEIIECGDFYKLIEFMLPLSDQGLRQKPAVFHHGTIPREKPEPGARKVGFITHFIDAQTMKAGDPSLSVLPDKELSFLIEKILPLESPTILGSMNISNAKGDKVHITIAGLGFTSEYCRKAISNKTTKPLIDLCEKAARLLNENEKVTLIGLGQFTSIVTNNGCLIPEINAGLTTGNCFTVFLGMEAIRSALQKNGLDEQNTRIAIIGAAGNIATIMTELLADKVGGIVLLGNPTQQGYVKTVRTARNLYQKAADRVLKNAVGRKEGLEKWIIDSGLLRRLQEREIVTTDPLLYEKIEKFYGSIMYLRVGKVLEDIRECNVVVAATNAAAPFLYPTNFNKGTIICDLSVPHNCSPELVNNNRSIEVIFGGMAKLPGGETIPVKGLPLEPGEIFGCMGETVLLGLEGFRESFSLGNISRAQVEWISRVAAKHGFTILHKHPAIEKLS